MGQNGSDAGTRTDMETYGDVALLGLAAGIRSMAPLALLAIAERRTGKTAPLTASAPQPWALLTRWQAPAGFGLAALGEMIADKLPFTPARIRVPVLAQRFACGAFTGVAICPPSRPGVWLSAAIGGVSAVAGATGAYFARQQLDQRTPLPDLVWGLVGDALAISLSIIALRRYLFSPRAQAGTPTATGTGELLSISR